MGPKRGMKMRMGSGMKMGMAALLALGLASGGAALVGGCTMASEECMCTMDYRGFNAVVIDASGARVDSATSKTVRLPDGKELALDAGWGRDAGRVLLFSDGNLKDIPEGRRQVDLRVTVSKGGKTASGDYTMSTDECRCHVDKGSGPDTLVLR